VEIISVENGRRLEEEWDVDTRRRDSGDLPVLHRCAVHDLDSPRHGVLRYLHPAMHGFDINRFVGHQWQYAIPPKGTSSPIVHLVHPKVPPAAVALISKPPSTDTRGLRELRCARRGNHVRITLNSNCRD
jgi:hypothetical protein